MQHDDEGVDVAGIILWVIIGLCAGPVMMFSILFLLATIMK